VITLVCLGSVGAQASKDKEPPRRYDVRADLETYPQSAPKETLESAMKAIKSKRMDYLLAHLADPEFVDKRVQEYGGRFDEVVREAKAKLVDDPSAFKQLQHYLREGQWQENEMDASVGLKDGKEHVYFRKLENRWFMHNRKTEPEKPKD
jgi:hypothetical protein